MSDSKRKGERGQRNKEENQTSISNSISPDCMLNTHRWPSRLPPSSKVLFALLGPPAEAGAALVGTGVLRVLRLLQILDVSALPET